MKLKWGNIGLDTGVVPRATQRPFPALLEWTQSTLPGVSASSASSAGTSRFGTKLILVAAPSPGLPYLAFQTPLWGPLHSEEVAIKLLFSLSGTGSKGDIIKYPRSVLELKTGALRMGRACPPRPCKPHGTGACTVGHVCVQQGLGAWEEACYLL